MAQWLELHAFSARDPGSIPDGELKICNLCSAASVCMYVYICVNMCVYILVCVERVLA